MTRIILTYLYFQYIFWRRWAAYRRRLMMPTSAPLCWKETASGVNCNLGTWLSRYLNAKWNQCVLDLLHQDFPMNLIICTCLFSFVFFTPAKVRVLLIELEEARGNHVVHEEDVSSADVSSTSEVISQHLVTFRSVEELQKQNQRLLVALRELGDAQEKEEFEIKGSKYVLFLKSLF